MLDQRNDRWLTHLATGLALLALLFFALTVVRPLARLHTDGFAGYYTIGHIAVYTPEQLALAYDEAWYGPQVVLLSAPGVREVFKNQPPPGSLLLAPLVWLPYPTARLVWLLLNLGFLVVSLMLLARAVRWPARAGLWIAPFCLLYRPVYENLRQGQMYLWLLVWLCLALWALATGPARPRAYALGGVMLGLLLIFKTAVIWLWPLLALARRWQILLWGGITAAAVALLSLFYFGLAPWRAYLDQMPLLFSMPDRYATGYQTITSLFGHLFVAAPPFSPAPVAHLPALATALTLTVQMTTLVITARGQRMLGTDHAGRVLSLALLLSLAIANAPLGEGYHYTLILPALLMAAWWAWTARLPWPQWALLALAALLLSAPWPYQSPQLSAGWWALLAYPRVYGAYALWGWLLGRRAGVRDQVNSRPLPPFSSPLCGEEKGSGVEARPRITGSITNSGAADPSPALTLSSELVLRRTPPPAMSAQPQT